MYGPDDGERARACGPLYEERQRYWERGLGRGWQVYGPDLTLPFSDVPSVLAVFFSKPYKTRGTSPKKGEKSFFSGTPDFEKVKKTMVKLQKWQKWKFPGVYHRPKLRCHSKTF